MAASAVSPFQASLKDVDRESCLLGAGATALEDDRDQLERVGQQRVRARHAFGEEAGQIDTARGLDALDGEDR